MSNALVGVGARGVRGGEFDDVGEGASSSISISSRSTPAAAGAIPGAGMTVAAPGPETGNGYSDGTTWTWQSSKCSTRACRSFKLVPQQVKSRQNSFSRVVGFRYSARDPPVVRDWEALKALMRRDDSDSTEPVMDEENLKSEFLEKN